LEKQLAIKKSKQTEDTLNENFHRTVAMNSFLFPNHGTIPLKNTTNNRNRSNKIDNNQKCLLKQRGNSSIHRTHTNNDEQCFTLEAKQAQINTIQEEDEQEEITIPFRLIGLTDMQGNLLQAIKDSGTGPSLVRASAVLNAQAQKESVPQKLYSKLSGINK